MNTIENHKFKTFMWLICNECINMGTLHKWMSWEEDAFLFVVKLDCPTFHMTKNIKGNKISICL